MAVPFSRPCYTGTNNNSGSGSSSRRRPRGRPSQQPQPQQNQQHQHQQESNNQHQQHNQDHPVTRFLYGDGQIHLDSLSLTSRIAFYALYEAWRLLQDLTQNQNGSSSVNNNRRRRTRPQQTNVPVTPVRTSSQEFVRPDVVPRDQEVSTQSTYSMVTSDVESACSSPFESPVKSHGQVKRQRLMSSSEDEENDCRTHERFTADVSSRRHFNNYPDMIPDDYDSCKPINNNSSNWSSNYPDLISNGNHHHRQDDSEEEEEEEKGYDDVDGGDDSRLLNNVGGVDWSKLGSQLCSIASSFESTFYKPVTDEQKAIYEAFQRIKMSSSHFLDRDNSLSGLAKTICRQVLLSSIWILLKKVLWRCKKCELKYVVPNSLQKSTLSLLLSDQKFRSWIHFTQLLILQLPAKLIFVNYYFFRFCFITVPCFLCILPALHRKPLTAFINSKFFWSTSPYQL